MTLFFNLVLGLTSGLLNWLIRIPGSGIIFAVRMYQVCISPMLGSNCRYQPTCSSYCIQAVKKYGAILGGCKSVGRICRCHPFREGGYDPP